MRIGGQLHRGHSLLSPAGSIILEIRNSYYWFCPSTVSRTRATAPLRRSLTMVTKKPPVDPPDTARHGEESSFDTQSEVSGHNSAESSESFDSNSDENEYVERPMAPKAGVHPVQLTVFKDGNVSRFLSNLLINLQKVDRTAKILAHPEASSQYAPLQRTKDIPNDETARRFISAYIAGVRVTPQGDMKGKVWIQSQAKFSNIKKNTAFSEWLNGSTTSPNAPRIELKLSDLPGMRTFATGLFLNIVTRFDLMKNFHDQIANALALTVDESGPIPEFQIDIFPAHGKTGRTRLYRMVTSSLQCAEILNAKMTKMMPSPTVDISYIKYQVWDLLPNSKKIAYYDMQKSFNDNHGALLLRGVRDPQAIMGKLNATGTETSNKGQDRTIYKWLTMLKAADKFTLFPKVLPNVNGEIELWHHISHAQEARAWATTALAEIARLSKVAIMTDKERASELFTNPEKVQQSIDMLRHEVSLPQARSAFLNYQPPVRTNDSRQERQGPRNRRTRTGPPKLVFKLNAIDEATNKVPEARAEPVAKAWQSRRNQMIPQSKADGKSASNIPIESSDSSEEASARNAAATAIATANQLTQKYPSPGNTAHQGMYDTIADKFGNLIPVVTLNGHWVVLTEKTLLASRKNAKPRNFGIAAFASTPKNASKKRAARIVPNAKETAEKKRWGDEDSSKDEWTKAQNQSFQDMDTETAAETEARMDAEETEARADTKKRGDIKSCGL